MKNMHSKLRAYATRLGIVIALFSLSVVPVFATENHYQNNGSITVCKMIVDNNGNIATTSANLPEGSFSITISKGATATSSTPLQTITFDADTFSPNKKLILNNKKDAECVTIKNLDPESSYFYSEETTSSSDWTAKKYNDQSTLKVNSLADFFVYSPELWNENPADDNTRNQNSDGQISLSKFHSDRTLVLLNTYKAVVEEPKTLKIVASKVVCNAETDLPNWSGSELTVSFNTASDFVASHPNCHLESGWKFQWGFGDKQNVSGVFGLSGDFVGEADGSQGPNSSTGSSYNQWKTFGVTDASGVASTTISNVEGAPRIWVREVLKSGYIPFTYNFVPETAPGSNVSAEMWCHSDVLNYDNFDFISSPVLGETYYCVAFNAASSTPALPQCSDDSDNDQDNRIDEQDPGCHTDSDPNNPSSYDPNDNDETNQIDICTAGVIPHGSDAPVVIMQPTDQHSIDSILNGFGYSVSTTTDQDPHSTWEFSGNKQYEVEVTLLASYAEWKSVFGYYEKGNPSSFTPIFRTGDVSGMSGTSTPILAPGATTTITINSPREIGFAIIPFGEGAHATLLATEKSLNTLDGNTDHAVVFDLSDAFAIGFEDILATRIPNDQDFNDVVVLVKIKSCKESSGGGGPVNVKPVINLLGDNPMNLTLGENFIEPGATAFDTEDGNITANIVKGGSVATTTVGTYTLTYNVTDSGGLSADQVTRTVNVNLPPNPGVLNVCKVIVNQNNTIATTSSSLPAGAFSIKVALTTDFSTSTIQTVSWDSETFNPNRNLILGDDDAECVTLNNLSLGSYYYSEETISGSSAWATTTKYNDQDSATINNVFDFFVYDGALFTATTTDDAERNVSADGQVTLSLGNMERTLVVLNKYDTTVLPQCSDNKDNDLDGKIDVLDPACHTDGNATNTPSYDPNLDSENSKPIITLIGNASITTDVGLTYTDQGAEAFDEEDGNITANIVKGGSVDTTAPSTNTLTYNVVDSKGLSADQVTRTVTVVNPGGQGGGGNGDGGGSGNGGSGGGSGGGGGSPANGPITPFVPTVVAISSGSGNPTTTGGSCYYLFDFLKQGENNDPIEVRKLQVFLKDLEGFNSLEVTGIFDDETFRAVSAFQEKYKDEILTPWGHDASTGYVYILTKKKVNEIYCQTAFPVNALEQSEIDAFRNFLISLRDAGVISGEEGETPFGNIIPNEVEGGVVVPNEVGIIPTDISGTLDNVGTTSPINNNGFFGLDSGNFLSNLASALFTLPTNLPDALISLFTLLLALVVIYITGTLFANSQSSFNKTPHQLRARKAGYFTIGVFLALIGSYFFRVYSLILPLLIVFVTLIILWFWYRSRKVTSNMAIQTIDKMKRETAAKMTITTPEEKKTTDAPIILPGKTQTDNENQNKGFSSVFKSDQDNDK